MPTLLQDHPDLHDLRRRRVRHARPETSRRTSFAAIDAYEGTATEPISLHKYLYADADPVDHVDPSGRYTLKELTIAVGIGVLVIGTLSYALYKLYQKINGPMVRFMNGAQPINTSSDPRINAALGYLRKYAQVSGKSLYKDAANRMDEGINASSPYVKGNPSWDDRGATEQRPGLAKELRNTVISTAPTLNAADIAMLLFGEDQRREGDLGQDVQVLNNDVSNLQNWLNQNAKPPPTKQWDHPK